MDAVQNAVESRGVPAILNSDQGIRFTSEEYKQLLKNLHIRQSMDGQYHDRALVPQPQDRADLYQ